MDNRDFLVHVKVDEQAFQADAQVTLSELITWLESCEDDIPDERLGSAYVEFSVVMNYGDIGDYVVSVKYTRPQTEEEAAIAADRLEKDRQFSRKHGINNIKSMMDYYGLTTEDLR